MVTSKSASVHTWGDPNSLLLARVALSESIYSGIRLEMKETPFSASQCSHCCRRVRFGFPNFWEAFGGKGWTRWVYMFLLFFKVQISRDTLDLIQIKLVSPGAQRFLYRWLKEFRVDAHFNFNLVNFKLHRVRGSASSSSGRGADPTPCYKQGTRNHLSSEMEETRQDRLQGRYSREERTQFQRGVEVDCIIRIKNIYQTTALSKSC